MSLKHPYLDTQGLSPDEAYKMIRQSVEYHLSLQDKSKVPAYRAKQILNAIAHSSLPDEKKSELKQLVSQLKQGRKNTISAQKHTQNKQHVFTFPKSMREAEEVISSCNSFEYLEKYKRCAKEILNENEELATYIIKLANDRLMARRFDERGTDRVSKSRESLEQKKKDEQFNLSHPRKVILSPMGGQNGKSHH